jgi:Protein of unknown function (DUF1501)
MNHPSGQFCRRTRREFLWETGGGFGAVALTGLLSADGFFNRAAAATPASFANPLAPKPPHFAPKAKSVIFIFCYGGPSHVDTFDYKPNLYPLDGKTIPVKTFGRGGHKNEGRVVGPKWQFKQYGQCGKYVSDLFPHVGGCVDDIAFLHSLYAESPIHGSAMLMMNSGRILSGHPSLGSWVNYGLGTVNQNLPGYVVMLDRTGGPISGAKNWSSGYMPAAYQGVVIRADGTPIHNLDAPPGMTSAAQRRLLDRLREKNEEHLARRADNSELSARIASYELAFKMQRHAPEAVDLSRETEETKKLYGIDDPKTADFGRKCLLARRLVERGVRFVQIYSGGAHNDDNWDAHTDIVKNHTKHAADRRVRRRHRPRPQQLRLHDVDGRRRHQGGRQRRRDRRAGQRRGQGPLPRQEPARDGPAADGPRPQPAGVLLRRPRPEAGRRRGGRTDPADYVGLPDKTDPSRKD